MQRVIIIFIAMGCFGLGLVAQSAEKFTSSFGAPNLIPPDQAFVVSQPEKNVIEIFIAEGTYLYDLRTQVQNDDGELLKTNRSEAKIYEDPLLGPTLIHKKLLRITVIDAPKIMVLTYQGCADIGFCYQPQQMELLFSR